MRVEDAGFWLTKPNDMVYINPSQTLHFFRVASAEGDILSDHVSAADGQFGEEISKTSRTHAFLVRPRFSFARQTFIVSSVKVGFDQRVKGVLGKLLLPWNGGERGGGHYDWRLSNSMTRTHLSKRVGVAMPL